MAMECSDEHDLELSWGRGGCRGLLRLPDVIDLLESANALASEFTALLHGSWCLAEELLYQQYLVHQGLCLGVAILIVELLIDGVAIFSCINSDWHQGWNGLHQTVGRLQQVWVLVQLL